MDQTTILQLIKVTSVYDVFVYGFMLFVTWFCYKNFMAPYFSPLYKIPGCPYRPFVGNMLEARKSEAMTNCIRWMKKYNSKIIRFYFFGGQERILTADPDIFRHVLVTNSRNYRRTGQLSNLVKVLGGPPLFIMSGEQHHIMRKLCNPGFSINVIHDMIPVFAENARIMSKEMKSMIPDSEKFADIGVQKLLVRLTLEVICKCGFDYEIKAFEEPNSEREMKLRRIFDSLVPGFLQFLPFVDYLPTKSNRKLWEDSAHVKEFTKMIIKKSKQKGEQKKDLLSRLIAARDEEGGGLTDEELVSQVFGFLLAGFETTSTGMTWVLLQLAQYPEVQEKVRREVTEVLNKCESEITAETLSKLKYLTCVIKETLRLFPPITSIFRVAQSDDYLKGYYIPKGTSVGLHVGALHRLNWDDPDEFKPERFDTQEETEGKKFFPFGFGPYMCIGNKLSMMEMKTALTILLRDYKFTMTPGYTFRRTIGVVMLPRPSVILRVHPV